MATIALVGNPNCGKTTLFNALTGSRQHIGNWPGVTVERKNGFFIHQNIRFEVVDLPGVYSLNVASEVAAVDERIACEYVLEQKADVIVNILDASNLERHLYLTLQLIEMRVPLIIAVNMMDIARVRGLRLQLDKLSQFLGCPVVALQANKKKGLDVLRRLVMGVIEREEPVLPGVVVRYGKVVDGVLAGLGNAVPLWLATRLLEDDVFARQQVAGEILAQVVEGQREIRSVLGEDADILLADARYKFAHQCVVQTVSKVQEKSSAWTSRLDDIILNRYCGIPIFLGVMYCLFFFAINIGGALQDFFDLASKAIFVDGFAQLLSYQHMPPFVITLLADGVGKGINTTLTFIPVIGGLFFLLAFLEDSGYMARAAFVVDRVMRAFGLSGKAFVPMIVGFGCNVPAVMAARTLENKRDRILTIMMSPFMSCGARLAIYAIFTTAFFPVNGHNVVFALYLIGIMMAVLTGFILRKTLLAGDPAPLVMELPPYHFPQFHSLLGHAWQRLKTFIFRAGKLIVPICVLLGAMNTFTLHDGRSLIEVFGRMLTPIFVPMGLQPDNWPATVGLVTGVLAKEVVVGTLNTLYSQVGHLSVVVSDSFSLWGSLQQAILTIPANFSELGQALLHPVSAAAPMSSLDQGVYGVMVRNFAGQIGAFSYLLFVLLYFPCVSTTAVMLRELDYRWAVFSILWMTGVAYGTAVLFYQAATMMQHWGSSLGWELAVVAGFVAVITVLRGTPSLVRGVS